MPASSSESNDSIASEAIRPAMKDAPQKIETSQQKIVMTSTLGKASGTSRLYLFPLTGGSPCLPLPSLPTYSRLTRKTRTPSRPSPVRKPLLASLQGRSGHSRAACGRCSAPCLWRKWSKPLPGEARQLNDRLGHQCAGPLLRPGPSAAISPSDGMRLLGN